MDDRVTARRIDRPGSEARTAAGMLLARFAACMLKGPARVVSLLNIDLRWAEIGLRGARRGGPPTLTGTRCEVVVGTEETDPGRAFLHRKRQTYRTTDNRLAGVTALRFTIRREG